VQGRLSAPTAEWQLIQIQHSNRLSTKATFAVGKRNFPGRRQRPPKRSQQTNRQIAETKCVHKSPRVRGDSH
jgi:hypothetical protein